MHNELQLKLGQCRLILASQSPRRAELLRALDIDFAVSAPFPADERIPQGMSKEQAALYLACLKAENYPFPIAAADIVIAADTLVWRGNECFGKPSGVDHARRMLRALSGGRHEVITGVCLRSAAKEVSFAAVSHVVFAAISDADIDYYVHKYQPCDKAGAYGIQEWLGYACIERINGSYHNVMGLPVQRLYEELVKFLPTISRDTF